MVITDHYFSACSSSGSPEADKIRHWRRRCDRLLFLCRGVAGGYEPSLYGVVNGSNIPKISKEFLPKQGFYASSSSAYSP